MQEVRPNHSSVSTQLIPKDLELTRNGKTFRITSYKTRVGGKNAKWQHTDLTRYQDLAGQQLSNEEKAQRAAELDTILKEAEKVIDFLDGLSTKPDGLFDSHSFTLHFNQNYDEGPGILYPILNKLLNSRTKMFEYNPELSTLRKVTYIPTDGAKKKTFTINNDELQPDEKIGLHEASLTIHNNITTVAKRVLPSQPLPAPNPTANNPHSVPLLGPNDVDE